MNRKKKFWFVAGFVLAAFIFVFTVCKQPANSGNDDPNTDPEGVPPGADSGNYRNLFKEIGKTDAEIDAKVKGTWNKIFTGDETYRFYYPVGADMAYILDSGNNDVRSEGMSYGMMMAVQMNEKDVFDRLWKWARTYMYNETNKGKNGRGYFAWQMNTNGTTIDVGCAPDGEFYFATALLFASNRWGDGTGVFEYRKHAMQLLYDMIHRDNAKGDNYGEPSMFRTTHHNGYGQYMTTFQPQGSAGQFTDPSYHLPAFYEVWAIEMERDADNNKTWGIWPSVQALKDDAAFYRKAVQASREFFPKTTNATTGLGPDYANFDGTPTGGNHANFEYDAWRIAMNIAVDYAWWKADPWQVTFADRIQAFFYGKGVSSYKSLWQLNGTPQSDNGDHSPGLVACNAVASLATTHERSREFLEDFWKISMTPGKYRYYDGCLYMLGLLHVTGNFKAYLSGGATATPSSSISPATATFDKKTDLQQDIPVTMTLNGNTFVRIQNGTTTLTSGTHYIVSGNTVTLKKAYLAAQSVGTTTLTFYFSAGSNKSISITIKETTGGGGGPSVGGGTSFDFTTMTSIVPAITYYGNEAGNTGLTAELSGGVLKVTRTTTNHATKMFVLTFELGSQTLGDFTGVRYVMRGASGEYTNKDFVAEVLRDGATEFSTYGNNIVLIATHNNGLTNSFKTVERPFAGTAPLTRSGTIKIAFGFANSPGMGYDIQKIELYK